MDRDHRDLPELALTVLTFTWGEATEFFVFKVEKSGPPHDPWRRLALRVVLRHDGPYLSKRAG